MPTFDDNQYGNTEQDMRGGDSGSSADDMQDQLDTMAREATSFIADEARNNPYRTVLVAAGVGYVLGGGIPGWALRLGFNAASRMAIAAAVAKVTSSDSDSD